MEVPINIESVRLDFTDPQDVVAVESTLFGIGRELNAWPDSWEHRCFFRYSYPCSCGAVRSQLFWHARADETYTAWANENLKANVEPYAFVLKSRYWITPP